jgi:hypothetical protein
MRSTLLVGCNAQFLTASWEQFYRWLTDQNVDDTDARRLLQYLRDKSGGYSAGRLTAEKPPETPMASERVGG